MSRLARLAVVANEEAIEESTATNAADSVTQKESAEAGRTSSSAEPPAATLQRIANLNQDAKPDLEPGPANDGKRRLWAMEIDTDWVEGASAKKDNLSPVAQAAAYLKLPPTVTLGNAWTSSVSERTNDTPTPAWEVMASDDIRRRARLHAEWPSIPADSDIRLKHLATIQQMVKRLDFGKPDLAIAADLQALSPEEIQAVEFLHDTSVGNGSHGVPNVMSVESAEQNGSRRDGEDLESVDDTKLQTVELLQRKLSSIDVDRSDTEVISEIEMLHTSLTQEEKDILHADLEAARFLLELDSTSDSSTGNLGSAKFEAIESAQLFLTLGAVDEEIRHEAEYYSSFAYAFSKARHAQRLVEILRGYNYLLQPSTPIPNQPDVTTYTSLKTPTSQGQAQQVKSQLRPSIYQATLQEFARQEEVALRGQENDEQRWGWRQKEEQVKWSRIQKDWHEHPEVLDSVPILPSADATTVQVTDGHAPEWQAKQQSKTVILHDGRGHATVDRNSERQAKQHSITAISDDSDGLESLDPNQQADKVKEKYKSITKQLSERLQTMRDSASRHRSNLDTKSTV